MSKADRKAFVRIVDVVRERWQQPDSGLWEVRSAPSHFVHSKAMCWVAVDRAIRLLGAKSDWKELRERIWQSMLSEGRASDGRFLRAYGAAEADSADAALLQLPMLGIPAAAEDLQRTREAVELALASAGLMHRYRAPDGLSGGEGAFLVASFWHVDALLHEGRIDEARSIFERLLALANDVGLYAEEIDPVTHHFLGNFPQAFTHLGLLGSAVNLSLAERHGSAALRGGYADRARRSVGATFGWRGVFAAFCAAAASPSCPRASRSSYCRENGGVMLTRLLCLIVLLCGCAAAPLPPAATETLAPNSNLFVQGITPIPLSLVRDVEKYTDFRGHRFVAWHPKRREMLLAHRKAGASTAQLFRLAAPMAEPEPLTDGADPVSNASYEPREGKYLVFERASGGNEADQLYRLDLDTRATTLLTDPAERHDMAHWLHQRSELLVVSVPLDRTSPGGSRARIDTTLWLMDPLQPQAKRKLAELPGSGWYVASVSWDDRRLALGRYVSANESQVWLLDLATGKPRQLLPAAGGTERATHFADAFSRDYRSLYVVSDRASEFRELMRYDLERAEFTRLTSNIAWDITSLDTTEDGTLIALQANVDGRDELRFFDARTGRELPAPNTPPGNIGPMRFHKQGGELAMSINGAQGPSQIWSLEPSSGKVAQWTRAYAPPGVDTSRFTEQSIVRWTSFDGRIISGLLSVPPATRFPGKRPVLVDIHGGPEGQARAGFMGRYNYFIDELGIAIIQPNVRGSAGYGKTFLTLDNTVKREDSVKDIGALLDWIAAQPNLDASRVLVSGGSYGGYMSLAVATNYPERIAGAIDIVGISHFVTFLENTESYRRDLRRVEYGDERDPAMREFLDRISPLTNAHKISKPLFVVQGKNDPRVPYTEAEQIVAKARANGTPVWYLRADNEGHGFARKENSDFLFCATILFMRQTLLGPRSSGQPAAAAQLGVK